MPTRIVFERNGAPSVLVFLQKRAYFFPHDPRIIRWFGNILFQKFFQLSPEKRFRFKRKDVREEDNNENFKTGNTTDKADIIPVKSNRLFAPFALKIHP